MNLFGKDLICTQDWNMNELMTILYTAVEMKLNRYSKQYTSLLQNKNFLTLFFSPSVRTHLSFITAATDLGGHTQYMEPRMGRIKMYDNPGETIEDIANVVSGYVAGIGIRIMEDAIKHYRDGNNLIKEFAEHATVPVINIADDVCHPCQGLADIMGWTEWFSKGLNNFDVSQLKGKKLLLTWGKGALARSWNSPQEALMIASRFGMDITVARPQGYDFDPLIYDTVRQNCAAQNQQFRIIDDPVDGYIDTDIVYSRHWISLEGYKDGNFNKQAEIDKALSISYCDWITTKQKMKKTNNAIFTSPMPVDRNYEVEDAVMEESASIVYQIAHNRLHVQKAILANTMTEFVYRSR